MILGWRLPGRRYEQPRRRKSNTQRRLHTFPERRGKTVTLLNTGRQAKHSQPVVIEAGPEMSASLIDGKAIAREIETEVTAALSRLSFAPGLVAVRVGNDPASEIYVRSKAKKAQELGLRGNERVFTETLTEAELVAEVD